MRLCWSLQFPCSNTSKQIPNSSLVFHGKQNTFTGKLIRDANCWAVTYCVFVSDSPTRVTTSSNRVPVVPLAQHYAGKLFKHKTLTLWFFFCVSDFSFLHFIPKVVACIDDVFLLKTFYLWLFDIMHMISKQICWWDPWLLPCKLWEYNLDFIWDNVCGVVLSP